MAKEVVNVRLDPEVIISLLMIAEKGGVTTSDLLRWGILKVIEEFRNSKGKLTWVEHVKVEHVPRVLSEEEKHKRRVRASAQTYARVKLQQNHKSEYQNLLKDFGRATARSLLVRAYHAEYQELYRAAQQQP